jgi:hypothetical protein
MLPETQGTPLALDHQENCKRRARTNNHANHLVFGKFLGAAGY